MEIARVHFSGSTRIERPMAIGIVEETVRRLGGWLIDFRFFSNLALSLSFEIHPRQLGALLDTLNNAGISVAAADIDRAIALLPGSEPSLRCFLQLTFVHQEPDLRIPVPLIPG
jgi:hypothetical protein